MKKHWTMRVAVLMVALTLITSCFVSGTYAKYITTADGNDTARVAKFGVQITATGTLFDTTYLAVAGGNTPGGSATTGLTVKSSNTDKLVAPGTQNDTGLTFTVTGQPEVDVAVEMSIDDTTAKEIFLKTGNYADMTTAAADDAFNQATNYYPVQFTLTIGTGSSAVTKTGTLAEIKAALANASTAVTYAAGTDLAAAIGTIKLTWAWAYGTAGDVSGNDKADTLLGDLAADSTLASTAKASGTAAPITFSAATAGTDFCLDEVVDITINITQVD